MGDVCQCVTALAVEQDVPHFHRRIPHAQSVASTTPSRTPSHRLGPARQSSIERHAETSATTAVRVCRRTRTTDRHRDSLVRGDSDGQHRDLWSDGDVALARVGGTALLDRADAPGDSSGAGTLEVATPAPPRITGAMKDPCLRFPLTCPQCGIESLMVVRTVAATIAVKERRSMRLYAPCHDIFWDASGAGTRTDRCLPGGCRGLAACERFPRTEKKSAPMLCDARTRRAACVGMHVQDNQFYEGAFDMQSTLDGARPKRRRPLHGRRTRHRNLGNCNTGARPHTGVHSVGSDSA